MKKLQVKPTLRVFTALASGPWLLLPLLLAAIAHSAQLAVAPFSLSNLFLVRLFVGVFFGALLALVDAFLSTFLNTLEPHDETSACLKSETLCAQTIEAHRALVIRCALIGEFYWLQCIYLHASLGALPAALLLSFFFFHALGFVVDSGRVPSCALGRAVRCLSIWRRFPFRRSRYKGGSVTGLGMTQSYICRHRKEVAQARYRTQIFLPPL